MAMRNRSNRWGGKGRLTERETVAKAKMRVKKQQKA